MCVENKLSEKTVICWLCVKVETNDIFKYVLKGEFTKNVVTARRTSFKSLIFKIFQISELVEREVISALASKWATVWVSKWASEWVS